MKKVIYSLAAFILLVSSVNANVVPSGTAQNVAINFYVQTIHTQTANAVLAYTETSATGDPVYYAFNLNGTEGFVIVSAEDAGHPIIGYSTEGNFEAPSATVNPNFNYWMQKRKKEILSIRAENLQASSDISTEWTNYATGKVNSLPAIATASVAPLVKTTWNQNGGGTTAYNADCPGGSLTGCVATAMAQIMKYWAYPTKGTGSSSYTAGTYGTLSVNYGTTTYNWASMPLASSNANVATIMYDCGVSVQMSYSPSSSGAFVAGGSPSAQNSYPTYFGYDPGINFQSQSSYTTAAWITMLEAEFTATNPKPRPVQYQGTDTVAGGHSWVADGNDASNNIHMNWGWAGSDNGNFPITSLKPGNGDNFSEKYDGALFNIKPLVLQLNDAGVSNVMNPNGVVCSTTFTPHVTLKNFGADTLKSCKIIYNLDGGSNSTYNWTGLLASLASTSVNLSAMTSTVGTHTFTSVSNNPNATTDGNAANDTSKSIFTINTNVLPPPLQQGFESLTNLPAGWSAYHTPAGGDKIDWQVVSNVGHSSSYSIGVDNCDSSSKILNGNSGYVYTVVIPPYDFTNATSSTQMTFDVGYIPAYGTVLYTDTLAVYYSSDCGNTWTQGYLKGGTQLGTGPTFTVSTTVNCMAPTTTQWRNESVNLGSLAGQPSVMIKFQDISDWGNWIYVDNINIAIAATGIASVNSANGFIIYPNPVSSFFTIEGASDAEKIHYVIYNVVGSEVRSGDIATNGSTFSGKISVSDISQGMYFIRVTDGKNTWTKKLNVQ